MKINQEFFSGIDRETLADLYRRMLRIRLFEECVVSLFNAKQIICPIHLYVGQEAIAAGVCENLGSDDYSFSTHRSHGHYIAKGGSIKTLMAEILCRDAGCSRGHGGSMHVTDSRVGFMASSAIVAGTIPIAVGAALKIKMKNEKRVSVAFFGDGATDEGVFYESINFAALYKLPVIFVCENNLFSTHLPIFKRQSNQNLYKKLKAFNLESMRIDGNNVGAVFKSAKSVIDRARNGAGPSFLECMTYRWYSHVGAWPDLDVGFRKKKDVEYWMARCPIKALRSFITENNVLSAGECDLIEAALREEINDSEAFAKASPYPAENKIEDGLFERKGY
jgi:TPP-dependent pyruvate/acetoin dehydrogenase alpha subunit